MKLIDAAALLKENDGYLILTHKRPDGDTIGSGCALCRILRACGKTAFLQNNEDFTPRFEFLYNGLIAPANFVPKNILSVDIADISLLPNSAAQYGDAVLLCIDHHSSNTNFAKYSFVDSSRCAVGGIIWEIGEALGIEITQDMATAVYVAIATDTGCFRYPNTTARSHNIAACCIDLGVDYGNLNKMLFETKTRERFNVEKFIFENMRFECGGKVAVVVLTLENISSFKATQDDLDNLSSIPRKIEGVECSVILTQTDENVFKASVRSGEIINASKVCANFGGGGHKNAAGCTLKADAKTAAQMIVEAAEKALAEKGFLYV